MNRRDVIKCAAAAALLPWARLASAEINRASLIVGYPPGTATDGLARLLAERMRGSYAANFVVENRSGAGGQLAAAAVKTAPPNGTTILVSPIMVMSVVPHTFEKVSYDPLKDFIGIGNSVTTDFVLAVGPAVPASVTNVAEFIQWCKANPSKASFGTGATGTKIHFSGIKLGKLAGFNFEHVGYTNGGGALTDLAGGNIPSYIGTLPTVMPFLDRIRVLATMGSERSRFLPKVPTLAESGFKDMVINEAISLYLPANTPDAIVQNLHENMVKALASPEAAKTLETLGMEATPSNRAEFQDKLNTEYKQWGEFVRQIGFKQNS